MARKPIKIKNLKHTKKTSEESIPSNIEDRWILDTQKKEKVIEESRFTLVIPKDLHIRIKKYCASNNTYMKQEIIKVLEKHFPEQI